MAFQDESIRIACFVQNNFLCGYEVQPWNPVLKGLKKDILDTTNDIQPKKW